MSAANNRREKYQEARKQRKRNREVMTLLGCMVVLVTAFALMIPAISITQDAASRENGFYQSDQQSQTMQVEATIVSDDEGKAFEDVSDVSAPAEGMGENASRNESQATTDDEEASGEAIDATDDDIEDTGSEDANGDNASGKLTSKSISSASARAEVDDEAMSSKSKMPAQKMKAELNGVGTGETLTVTVEAPEGALPKGVTMTVEEVVDENVLTAAKQAGADAIKDATSEPHAARSASSRASKAVAVNITFTDASGEEIEPKKDVRVTLGSSVVSNAVRESKYDAAVAVIHMDDKELAAMAGVDELSHVNERHPVAVEDAKRTAGIVDSNKVNIDRTHDEVAFEVSDFSVYALVYTVDFHWDVDGESYEYSLVGGDSIGFRELVEALGVVDQSVQEQSDGDLQKEMNDFIRDVEQVEFSDESLIRVVQVTEDTTAEQMKSDLGIKSEYSEELTEEQTATMGIKQFEAPDWALISIKPFVSEEYLTVTMKTGEVFSIKVTDAQIKKTVIDAKGDTWEITVTYGDDAQIPEGSELKVREILEGTEEFEKHINSSMATLDANNGVVSFARFFDIEIEDQEGVKVEPQATVIVRIAYEDALDLGEDCTLSVVHFAEGEERASEEPEIISEIRVDETRTEICYEQNSFSVTGTVVQTPTASHQYALVIHHTDGNYYVVENDGTLTRIPTSDVTFNDGGSVQSVKMVNPICWTYQDIGYSNYTIWHDTDARAYDVPGTSLPTAYIRRYLSADVPSGYADLNDNTNLWNLNNRDYCPDDGRYVNLQYNANHTISHYNHVLGVAESPDGTLHVVGQAGQAAEIYFAETQSVPSVSVQNHTVNHIDISVEGSSSIKMPLAYGTYKLAKVSNEDLENIDNIEDISSHITGYRNDDLVVSHQNNVTLEVERMVPIDQNDIKKADITAYVVRDGQIVYLDDVYNVTGYSGNAETSNDTPQVRLEGSFKVADLNPVNGNEDQANNNYYWEDGRNLGPIKTVRLQRPIHYTVAVNKPVTFTMTYTDSDNQTYVVLKEDGTPFRVTVDVSLSSSFTYFDEKNTCPGIDLWTYGRDRWSQGEIRSNNNAGMGSLDVGPGFDFKLGSPMNEADHDIVAVEVTKYIQGDFGTEIRTLSLQEATTCDINVYQNNSSTPLHAKTLKVGKDGIGLINDYDVVAGTYDNPAYAQISEDPDSVDDYVTDTDGNKWTYAYSYVETEYAWRNNGQNNPSRYSSQIYTKDDNEFLSHSEVIGEYYVEDGTPYTYNGVNYDGKHEYNRFEEFYIYNIYKQVETVDVPIVKTWYDENGDPISDDDSDYDWTATFKLEEREVHEGGPAIEEANTTSWLPVAGVEPITIHKGDSEQLRTFEDLPKYRYYYDAEGNESVYRIMYSVSETEYYLYKNNTMISHWDEVNGLDPYSSVYYAPQFPHDAGDADDSSGIGVDDPNFYNIVVENHVSKEFITEEIDLVITKEWDNPQDLVGVTNPSATFQLKRYKMEEYYSWNGTDWIQSETIKGPEEDTVFTSENHLYTLSESNEWSLAIPRLPKTSELKPENGSETEKTVCRYSYYFYETASNPPGFYAVFKTSGDSPVIVDEAHRVDVTGTEVVAENKPAPETLLYKVDESNIKQQNIEQYLLPGASFTIVKYKAFTPQKVIDKSWGDQGTKEATRKSGDPDGKFVVDGLIPGLYEIEEIDNPDGYIQATENPRFEVALNAATETLEISSLSSSDIPITIKSDGAGGNAIIYGNTPGTPLPVTGGIGTELFTILGALLIALAGGGLLVKRLRKNP